MPRRRRGWIQRLTRDTISYTLAAIFLIHDVFFRETIRPEVVGVATLFMLAPAAARVNGRLREQEKGDEK